MTYCRIKLAWNILLDKWWAMPKFFVPALWAFSIYQKIPEFLGSKWNMTFWFVPLEIFRNKRNSWKCSPVFPVETSQWKICVPFTDLSPVPCLLRSFKLPDLPWLYCVSTKMAAGSVFSKLFANKISGLLWVLCLSHVLALHLENLLQHECACLFEAFFACVRFPRKKNSEKFFCNSAFTGEIPTIHFLN